MTGIVFDIQRAGINDGPGLRTVIFLKGCPLHCSWCHNPESIKFEPETGKSGKVYGRAMSVDEVMKTVLADRTYYEASGGGITLSGGEPTAQFLFCKALLKAAKTEGIHTCLDTCGQLHSDRLLDLIPLVDLFHYDWKAGAQELHDQWTGGNAELIRKNLDLLRENKCVVCLRCPIVPEVNDTPEHDAVLNAFKASGDFTQVERLPYHTIGQAKLDDLNV